MRALGFGEWTLAFCTWSVSLGTRILFRAFRERAGRRGLRFIAFPSFWKVCMCKHSVSVLWYVLWPIVRPYNLVYSRRYSL